MDKNNFDNISDIYNIDKNVIDKLFIDINKNNNTKITYEIFINTITSFDYIYYEKMHIIPKIYDKQKLEYPSNIFFKYLFKNNRYCNHYINNKKIKKNYIELQDNYIKNINVNISNIIIYCNNVNKEIIMDIICSLNYNILNNTKYYFFGSQTYINNNKSFFNNLLNFNVVYCDNNPINQLCNLYKKLNSNILYIDATQYNETYKYYIKKILRSELNLPTIISNLFIDYDYYDKRIIYLPKSDAIINNEVQLINYLNSEKTNCITNMYIINDEYNIKLELITIKIIDDYVSKKYNINNNIINNDILKICIMCHIGNNNLISEIFSYFVKIRNQNINGKIDIYVNIVDTKIDDNVLNKKIKNELSSIFDKIDVKILINENRGFDIGGYFNILKYLQNNDLLHYDFYVLIHSKSDNEWRKKMLDTLLLNLNNNINFMIKYPCIGILGPSKYLFNMAYEYTHNNYNHLNYLFKLYNINNINLLQNNSFYFFAGTCFILSKHIIDLLTIHDFDLVYKSLNDANTIDYNWYLNKNVHDDVSHLPKNKKLAYNHYNNIGKKKGYYPNLLSAIISNKSYTFRDGMIEHAYERLFGALAMSNNKIIYGI